MPLHTVLFCTNALHMLEKRTECFLKPLQVQFSTAVFGTSTVWYCTVELYCCVIARCTCDGPFLDS